MKHAFLLSAFALMGLAAPAAASDAVRTTFRATLRTPGGELPFFLELAATKSGDVRAWVHNGPEQIALSRAAVGDHTLTLSFAEYDSRIDAQLKVPATGKQRGGPPGADFQLVNCRSIDGAWTKTTRDGGKLTLPFHADRVIGSRFARLPAREQARTLAPSVAGRWAATFKADDEAAVGVFEQMQDGTVHGTFLTEGGDYRYLAGSYEQGVLRLSCFDGAHAFLFIAQMQADGRLQGDFWSGPKWHDTWVARRDERAALHDGFSIARANGKADFEKITATALDGGDVHLKQVIGDARGVLIEVFGSWCPNCADASSYLAELDRKYGRRGLRVVGLAFEYTGRFERDSEMVRRFAAAHGAKYPMLVAGKPTKENVAAVLPFIEGFRAYPTFVFARSDGTVEAIYTGFSGPATKKEYDRLRAAFEEKIEHLLRAPTSATVDPGQTEPRPSQTEPRP